MTACDHSFFPPSGAAAWKQCPMWPTMNALYPRPETPESLEGNAAHWVAWEALAGRFHDLGTKAPNGSIVTEEMIEGAELMMDTVAKRIGQLAVNVERPVAIPRVHNDCWGTPDLWAFDPTTLTLEILDYKFGHRFVDEVENDQGIAYIAGIIDELAQLRQQPVGVLDQEITVNFTIVQPRCFYKGSPVRTWTVKAVDLRGHINKLANATQEAKPLLGGIPESRTNSECIDCPGSHACAAAQEAAYDAMEYATKSSPVELTPAAAGLELRMMERSLERLTARVEGMRENVLAMIRQGYPIPWYKAEQNYGRATWSVPIEQVIAFGQLMGVNLEKKAAITPNQAEKAGIDEGVIKAYSITPPGKIKLVPINPSDAARVFGTSK